MGIIDEVRDHDGDLLNEVILPLMNVNRRTKARKLNQNEPHQAQIFITSAGQKATYAYDKLIEILVMSAVSPKSAFCWGCDYRVPMLHGVIDEQYISEMKMSDTMKTNSFAREYLSIWTGGSEESWFDFDRLTKHRVLVNPETKANLANCGSGSFYMLSVDVARLNDLTVITVFKVIPKDTYFQKKIVNIIVLEATHFAEQALVIKKLKESFQPKEIVIDGNGLTISPLSM